MRASIITANLQQIVQKHTLAFKLVAVALLTIIAMGIVNRVGAEASGGDCSANSIIKCGIAHYGDLTAKYDQNAHGDVRAIMDHYWIKRTPEHGNRVLEGVANNRGEVIADGRVVANNAASIGRQAIAHSRQISIAGRTYYETTHVNGLAFKPGTTQLPALVVIDGQGNFKYAILKACGNPIYASPVPPPKPPTPPAPTPPAPEKKEVVRCDMLSVEKLERTKFKFSVNYTAENVTVKEVIFTVRDAQGKVITTQASNNKTFIYTQEKAGEYTVTAAVKATVNGKEVTETSDACEKKFVVVEEDKEVVCEISTKNLNKVVTKKEYEEDQKLEKEKRKYSKNQADCQEKPAPKENCLVPGKEHLPKDSPDCKEDTPVQLPKTGGTTIANAIIGVTAITVAAYYYLHSRRGL